MGLGALVVCGASLASDWHPVEQIRAAVEREAMAQLTDARKAQIESLSLRDDLKLPRCDRALHAIASQPIKNGRGVIDVSCTGTSAWRIHVPVRAVHEVQVVVAQRPIAASMPIGADDVALEWQASSSLPFDYSPSLDEVVGLTVRRTVPAGTVITRGTLKRHRLITRGAIVRLTTALGPVSVSHQGTALEDGAPGQRIQVMTSAGRVVEGIVLISGEVRVGG
ncbi:MAG: flagellar basal body P-ring formation chaperone FlgA [Gammaproteobacteria bacterium]|nr:flagellar basal body P-ring formation chaperone FlgA [Gammaproteobacteria bacterium]